MQLRQPQASQDNHQAGTHTNRHLSTYPHGRASQILAVATEHDVRKMGHEAVVRLIQEAGSSVLLTVISKDLAVVL